MIITLVVKNPDSIEDSINREAMSAAEDEYDRYDGVMEDLVEEKKAEIKEAIKKWIEYGEYVRIVIDTEAGTATVKEV